MVDDMFSRAALLLGDLNRGRRAAKLLALIESRCLYMRQESRRVIAAYLVEGDESFQRSFAQGYLDTIKLVAASGDELRREHLERFAPQWQPLLPADPDLRARLLHLIGEKYGLSPAAFAALGGAEPELQAAYQELYNQLPEAPPPAQAESPEAVLPEPDAHQDVETRLEWLSLSSGETLYRAGDPGDALYAVVSGRLRLDVISNDGIDRFVGEIARGELVGELEVLNGEARGATVRAVRDSELVRLCRSDLLALAQRHREVMIQINTLIARRLRLQYVQPLSAVTTLLTYALVPCDPGVPLHEFGAQLAQALGEFGPAILISSAEVDEGVEPGAAQASLADPRNPQIVSWLSELESRYQYVVYQAEPEASEWSHRCIRQADRVLLVGRAQASPQPADYESLLLASEPGGPPGSYGLPRRRSRLPAVQQANRVELVLLHPPGTTSPAGTRRWLAPRSLRCHYHVRLGKRGDVGYLARCLAGHALGLVLGGGGARGFAHVGVLRALEEAGLDVDLIGGTSMGALVTGGIGLGLDWRQMREISARLASPLKLFDPTLPVVSLFTTGKITDVFHQIYGDALIEDLWRPVFCVSSNLSRCSETVHRQGPLWKAVRASMAVPGIFAPVLYEGDVHVDGAVMNNLPVDVMRELGMAGLLIGVDVMPLQDLDRQYHFGDSISGPRAILSMLNPYDGTSAPNIYETLVRVMALHEVHQEEAKRRLMDISIVPPVEMYNILDFASYDPIIEIGYQATQKALAAWNGQGEEQPVTRQLESTLAELDKMLGEFDHRDFDHQ